MAGSRASIGDYDVTCSGNLVYKFGEKVVLRPFSDDEDFNIEIEVVISEDENNAMRTQIIGEDREYPLLKATRPKSLGMASSPSRELLVAVDENFEYYIFFTSTIGGNARVTFVKFDYTITQRPK